jgi:hypothetical protein
MLLSGAVLVEVAASCTPSSSLLELAPLWLFAGRHLRDCRLELLGGVLVVEEAEVVVVVLAVLGVSALVVSEANSC